MRRRAFSAALGAAVAGLARAARAQPSDRLRRVDMLMTGAAPQPLADAVRRELVALGWIEGRTVTFELRYAEGRE